MSCACPHRPPQSSFLHHPILISNETMKMPTYALSTTLYCSLLYVWTPENFCFVPHFQSVSLRESLRTDDIVEHDRLNADRNAIFCGLSRRWCCFWNDGIELYPTGAMPCRRHAAFKSGLVSECQGKTRAKWLLFS